MLSCHLNSSPFFFLHFFSFCQQSFLFGVKTSFAQALLLISKNKSWLSKCPAHSLSLCPSISLPVPLSLCLLLSAGERRGGWGGDAWQAPAMDPTRRTGAHIAIWHAAGAGGGRHFGFVSSSAQRGSCQAAEVAQVPGG